MPNITGNEDLLNVNLSLDDIDKLASNKYKSSGYQANIEPKVGEFTLDSKYDEGILSGQNQQRYRADAQSGAAQGFNAIVGGVASGLATAVEDVSYILDFDNHIKWLNGGDTWEKNWVAESMGNIKEYINEAMPIYRPNADTFDWDDSGFYWSSLKGVIDSAVGFGLPGGAIAKGVGAIGKGLGAVAKATKIARLESFVNVINSDARISNMLNSGGASFVQNYAEGKIMGIEAFENTERDLLALREKGELDATDEEIKQAAGEAADNMLLYNRAMILADAFALSGLMKGIGKTRGVKLTEPGFNNRIKNFGKSLIAPNSENLILQGGKEAVEEIGQNVMQMEAQYGAKKRIGADVSDYEQSFIKRGIDFATSDQALLEGMMGFFGGGPQRILSELTSGNFKKGSSQRKKEQYNKYQEIIAEGAEFVEGSTTKFAKMFQLRDEHLKAGNIDLAKATERKVVADIVIQNAANGTLDQLESQLELLANGEATDQQKENWGEGYQETAREMLDELKVLEKEWLKYSNNINVHNIVGKFAEYRHAKAVKLSAENKLNEISDNLKDVIESVIVPKAKFTKKSKDGTPSAFTYDISNLNKNPYTKASAPDAYDQYEKFKEKLEKYSDYESYNALKDLLNTGKEINGIKIESLTDQVEKASKEYEYAKTEEAGKKLKKEYEEENKKAEAAAKRAEEEGEVKKESPELKSVYKDNKGKQYKVVSLDASGTIEVMPLLGKGRNTVLTRDQFDKKFLDSSGKYTKVANKEEIKNSKNEEETKKAKEDIKNKPEEERTSEEKKVDNIPNDPQAPTEFEPENKKENEDDELEAASKEETYNGTKNPLALAWLSANNTEYNKDGKYGDFDITEYLEDKNNDVIGQEVSITLGLPISMDKESEYYKEMKELLDRYENAKDLSKKERELLLKDLIDKGSIKVTFTDVTGKPVTHNGTAIELFLHTPNFKSIKEDKVAKTSLIDLRKRILESLLNGNTVTSKVTNKKNGSIQNGELIEVDKLFIDKQPKDIELLVRDKSGNYMKGVDRDGHIVTEKKLRKYRKEGLPAGAIFALDSTANGEPFPVRLHTDKLNEEEAEIVFMIYNNIIGIRGYNLKSILTAEVNAEIVNYIKNSTNPRVNMLLGLLPNGEQSTMLDLLNEIVYEGKSATVGKDSQLYTENGKVNFANFNGAPIYFGSANALEYKDRFIRWLTEEKVRNVDFKRLNNPKYKDFLISQGVLKTNAIPGTQGAVFAQPLITIAEPTNIAESKVKKVDDESKKEEGVTGDEEVIAGSTGDPTLDALFGTSNDELSDILEEVEDIKSNKVGDKADEVIKTPEDFERVEKNTEIKIGKEDLNAYIAQLKVEGNFSKETIDEKANTLYESFALYLEMEYSPKDALEEAKKDLLSTLENC